MKSPSTRPITRMFPIGTAGHNSRLLAMMLAGSSLLGATARATIWDGSTSTDWNDPTNWVGNAGTAGSNAEININSPRAVISANIVGTPVDILVGNGAGATGRLDHTAGTAATGAGNWMLVGRQDGGTGIYNLANTAASGGTLTGFGLGSGTMTVGGRLYVGGAQYGGSTGNGTVNVNTSGTLAIGNDLAIGSAGGTGIVNLDAGTVTTGGWNFFGKVEGDVGGGDGTFNMSGGTFTNTGRQYVGQGNTTGRYNQSGGTFNNNGPFAVGAGNLASANLSNFRLTGGALNTGNFVIGGEAVNPNNQPLLPAAGKGVGVISGTSTLTVNGELWVGNEPASSGDFDIIGGTISVNNWVVIGRNGGTGIVDMSGGSLTKTGGGNFSIGNGTGGTFNMTGGTVSANNEFWVGQAAGGVGRLTVSAGTVSGNSWMAVGREGSNGILTINGTGLVQKETAGSFEIGNNGTSVGVVNLDGGTLRVDEILTGGGSSTFNFNGGRLQAVAGVENFMQGLTNAFIKAGGAVIDSAGFNVTINQLLQDDPASTGGTITKTGAGTLILGGANTYAGAEVVTAGSLVVSTNSANTTTNVTVANGAGYGVLQSTADTVLTRNNITFGTTGAGSLNFNLGNLAGNPTVAPLNVTGTLRLNGPVTINIVDQLPEPGPIRLISYAGAKTGAGSFVLGTLPNGVVATLSDNGTGLVTLNVTSVALPYWNGSQDNVWNTTTPNFINEVGGMSVAYKDGNPVLFDDRAAGPGGPNIALNTTVTPASVTFNNATLLYSLSGTGKISGGTGLLKQGTAPLSIANLNDYTGVTTLTAGTTLINSLGNGGVASSIGAASAAASNIIFNGGALEYTGPPATTNRGFSLAGADSTLSIQNDLTGSGPIVTNPASNLIKAGTGNLILTNSNYTIGSANPGLRISGGTLTLSGAGTQTVNVGSDLWVGNVPDVPAALVLQGTTLNVAGFLALGRGNGAAGTVSTLSVTNSNLTTGNFSSGFADNRANDNDQNITLVNSTWTNNGQSLFAESANATTTFTVSGTSRFQANAQLLLGLGQDSVVNLVIENSGSVTKTGGWLAIGNSSNGSATVTVKDSGSLSANGDFNIGDVGTSTGVLNIQNNASVTATDIAFIGKNTGTTGSIIQTGGTFNGGSWISVGRFAGSTGVLNLSGGTFNQNGTGQRLIIGEEGTGTVTISGTAAVTSLGDFVAISNAAGAVGVLNLNGGTLTARRIAEGAAGVGSATVNFNGGLLRVGANPNADYLNGLDAANVLAGGVNIDTNGNNIAIGQALLDSSTAGGLTKTGLGALQLNGNNTYTGTTAVTMGTLGGTGSIAGPLTAAAGTTIAPGAAAPGTFTIGGATTLSGTYAVEIDGGANDTLAVTNTLNVSAATLAVSTLVGGATQSAYIIAAYTGATPAPFAAVTGLPAGYTVNYAYNNGLGSRNIALVSSAVAPSFSAWISGFFPGETNPAIVGRTADPDRDGQSNGLEFALGGAPDSGSNNAKIFTFAADSDGDADTTRELLMTIAVRTGSPAFTGTPAPSSTFEGFTVRAEGGSDLTAFPTAVNPVGVVSTGLPAAPSGYEYRTFSLSGSNGLTGRGFIRAKVPF